MLLRRPDSLSITFTGPGRVAVERERLRRPRKGEALLTARCSLISVGTERRALDRDFAAASHWEQWVTYPFRPGYSFVGTTEPGSRVCAHAPHAQRVIVAAETLVPVPDQVSDATASCFALAAIAQAGVAAAEISPGDPIVVIGAGMLGQLVAQFARVAGAAPVIVVARSRPRLDIAVAHGASVAIAAAADRARAEVMAQTGGEGAAVVFDVTGDGSVVAAALKLARTRGTVVVLGDAADPSAQRLGPELLLKGLRIVGVHSTHATLDERRRMAEEFFAAALAGEVTVEDLITERVRPQDAAAVYSSLKDADPDRLGVLFDWSLL